MKIFTKVHTIQDDGDQTKVTLCMKSDRAYENQFLTLRMSHEDARIYELGRHVVIEVTPQ